MISELFFDLFHSLRKRKIQTFLTGFGISWGIFILIVLLGVSNGFKEGVMQLFRSYVQNSIWIYGGQTLVGTGNTAYAKPVRFRLETIRQLKNTFPRSIKAISPEGQIAQNVVCGGRNEYATIRAVSSEYFQIKNVQAKNGRLLNKGDDRSSAKVVVLGGQMKEKLFGKGEATGKYLQMGHSVFTVVGVLKGGNLLDPSDQNALYIPYSTALQTLLGEDGFSVIALSFYTLTDSKAAEATLRGFLGRLLHFDGSDSATLYVLNLDQQVKSFRKFFRGLNIFLWFIGLCLLISGLVGVANIMFVVIRERTNEIGIRKAIGATPQNIIQMILFESIVVTFFAGMVGIVLGAVLLFAGRHVLHTLAGSEFLIKNLQVNWMIVGAALFVLIISGIAAGLVPAVKASEIEPIDAIRSEW
ncbi:MAG TPA: ABC transporter permease [Prolixibacteraceae bacterium]|nr:ABC transporter permease [Prolixibacteraceae bacterium]